MSLQGANQSKQQQPEPVTQRLYVGGLSAQVTAEELTARFQPFGRVDDCYLPRDVLSGGCRGFGYVSLNAPEEKLKRCLSLYNGSKWKGMQLRLEKAKEGYMERLRSEREANSTDPPRKAKRKWPFVHTSHSEDMTLANDKNIGKRKGWKHGRFGRAVAVMRVRKPGTRSIVALDPTIYKTNITKLFGTERPKDILELTWRINDDDQSDETSSSNSDESDDGEEEPVKTEAEAYPADKFQDRIPVIENVRNASPGAEAVALLRPEYPSTDALSSHSGTVDIVPPEGDDLACSSDTGVDVQDDVFADLEELAPISPDVAPNDYAGEADDGVAAVRIPQFDGAGDSDSSDEDREQRKIARKRKKEEKELKLNKTPRSDHESSAEENAKKKRRKQHTKSQDGDNKGAAGQASASPVNERKARRSTISKEEVNKQRLEALQKRREEDRAARYAAIDTVSAALAGDKPSIPTHITFSDDEEESVEGTAEAQAVVGSTCQPQAAVPAMQKSKTFKVDKSLADVFRPGTELGEFSLFGGDDLDVEMIEEEEEELEAVGQASSALTARSIAAAARNPPHTTSAQKTKSSVVRREALLAPMSTFFFYFNDTGRSSNIAEIGSFKRTESPEEIKANWESYRQELTSEFKRKHKSGVRKRARFLKSGHTTEEAASAAQETAA